MSKYAVHRCRLFNYTPSAIQCMASHQIKDSKEGAKLYELAVGQENGAIQIIQSSPTGFYVTMTIPGSSRRIEDLVWCNDRLFSAELQGVITEYNLTNGTVKYSEDSYGGAVWCLAAGFGNSLIAAGCEDGSIKIFDCKNKLKFEKSLDRQEGRILSCAFHPNNHALVSGSVDVIRIWSYKSGHAIQRIRLEHSRNTDTIVWAVKFLTDHTIISGDSTGKVQFWNSKNATLIKSFHAHQADILALCVSQDESTVYASGVDPKVIEMRYVEKMEEEVENPSFGSVALPSVGNWVSGAILLRHTHDVRSLVLVGGVLASGGVDTNILLKSVEKSDRRVRKVAMFPHTTHVHFATNAKQLLFQYSDYLEIWKVGTPISNEGKTGEELELFQQPTNLLHLKTPSRESGHISCSNISQCGRWVAYSTKSSFRLFHHDWQEGTVAKIHVSWFKPAFAISFMEDSSHMIISGLNRKISIINLDADGHGGYTAHIAHVLHDQSQVKDRKMPFHLLATSTCNKYLAAGDLQNRVVVFNMQNQELHCTLPERGCPPTVLAFKPSSTELFVVYQDHEVVEYDIISKSYTRWCRNAHSLGLNLMKFQRTYRDSRKIPTKWNSYPILHISFNSSKIVLASQKALYIIDQSKSLDRENWEGDSNQSNDDKKEYAIKYFAKFQPLLYAGVFEGGNSIVAVERPLSEIQDSLPPTLYQKKFGT